MSTENERTKMLETIRRLAAMANPENGAFPQEIATASAKMQALMDKYNISMADVMNVENVSRDFFTDAVSDFIIGKLLPWHWRLGQCISRITSTRYYASGGFGVSMRERNTKNAKPTKGMRMSFFGAPEAVKLAVELFEEWVIKIDDMAKVATSEYIQEWESEHADEMEHAGVKQMRHMYRLGDEHPNVWRNSWLDGVVRGIDDALYEQEKARTQQTSTALMVITTALTAAYQIRSSHFSRGGGNSNSGHNSSAYSSGLQVGKNISIGSKRIG